MLQTGSLLCLWTLPFGAVNSFYHLTARYPSPQRTRAHLFNLAAAIFFVGLALAGSGSAWGESQARSEEHTSELQSRRNLVCRILLEKKKKSMS